MKLVSWRGALLAVLAQPAFFAVPAQAGQTQVATISGCYDCLGQFDTPVLVINNSTGGTITNAQMLLTGYQGDNNGQSATVSLGTLAAGSTQLNWGGLPGSNGSTSPFNLTAYDYDDEFINTQYQIPTSDCGNVLGCVSGGGPQWYAQTGNFEVTFSGTVSGGQYDGQSVYAQFTPANNATGGFVPWEGLDATGYSEQPCCDQHSGTVTGDLANIFLGTAPPPGVPEPATWAMMLAGFAVVGAGLRRRATVALA